MAGEVAPGELRQRLVLRELAVASRRRALVEQGVGRLLAAAPSVAHQGVELGAHEDVEEALAGGLDARPGEGPAQLVARQVLSALERADHHGRAAREHATVETDVAVVAGHLLAHARRRQRLHPANVGGQDGVPGRPQDVDAEDLAGVECGVDAGVGRAGVGEALADRPAGPGKVLRLHRRQPAHDVGG